MKNNNTLSGIVKRVLLYAAPFLFISASIYLFVLFGVGGIIEGNIYYRLITLAPEKKAEGEQLVLTVEEKEALVDNNAGSAFKVVADFPPICYGEQWATITIDSAGVKDLPVRHGDDADLLWTGAGHYFGSRFPGQGGKVVIAAHVGFADHFQRLETMNIGDKIVLNTIYGDYEYVVRETVIFDEHDASYILPDDSKETLVCYTCYPFYTTSVRTQRFAVICDLVSGKDWTQKGAAQ